MSKQDHRHIDDMLREKLGGVRITPPEALRHKVEADFLRTRRRRLGFWWFFGGLGGVATLLTVFLLWPATPEIETVQKVALEQPVLSSAHPNGSSTLASDVDQSNLMSNVSDGDPSSNEVPSDLTVATNPVADAAEKGTRPNVSTVSLPAKVKTRSSEELISSDPPVVITDQDDAPTREERVALTTSQEDEALNAQQIDPSEAEIGTSADMASKQLPQHTSIDLLPLRSTRFSLTPELGVTSDRSYPDQPELPYFEEDGACPKWIIGASGGVGMSYRTLQSNVHHQLVEHKNQSEHASLSTSAGVYAVATLLGNSGVKTGFTYLRVGERYHFENDHASHATTNTYEYLNMDLKFNQSLFCKDRLRLDVAAGTKFNLLRDAQSSWLDPNSFEAVAHNNQGEHSPFRQYNLVWSADLTGYYFISKRGFIGLTIEADRFQNSIYKDAVELEQRPYAFQGYFNIGFRF